MGCLCSRIDGTIFLQDDQPYRWHYSTDRTLLAAVYSDHSIKIWDMYSRCLLAEKCLFEKCTALFFDHDNATVYLSTELSLEIWEWKKSQPIRPYSKIRPSGIICAIRPIHHDKLIIVYSEVIHVWDLLAGDCGLLTFHNFNVIGQIRVTDDEKHLLVPERGCIRVYETATGRYANTIDTYSLNCISMDGRWIANADSGGFIITDSLSNHVIYKHSYSFRMRRAIEFSTDKTYLIG